MCPAPEAAAPTFLANAVRYAAEQPLYLFEAFDEQRKSEDAGGGAAGDVVENHWGMLATALPHRFSQKCTSASQAKNTAPFFVDR